MQNKQFKFKVIFSMLIFSFLLTACGGGGESTKESTSLTGTKWELISFNNSKPIGSRPITLEFNGFKMSGNSGCNRYSGLTKHDGKSINLEMNKKDFDDKDKRILTTRMYCPSPAGLMDQETSYLEQLFNSRRVFIQGDTLIIKDGSNKLIYKSIH